MAFTRQYEGLDIALVKADWADVLDGTQAEDIAYALKYLPADKPPTALWFRDQCRRAPSNEAMRLPAPIERVADEVVQRVMEAVKPVVSMNPAEQVIGNIERLQAGGLKLTSAQRAMLAACESVSKEEA